MEEQTGGVDRTHDRSLGTKLVFAGLHAGVVVVCLWLGFGGFDWPDPARAQLLAACAVLYFLRHLVTLFLLLQRRVTIGEGLGLTGFFALFELGFLLLGAGLPAGEAVPFGVSDWAGLVLLATGSMLNTGSELQRWAWKRRPGSQGRCYTGGMFAWSMHVNYFGDVVLFTGWAVLTVSVWALSIPVLMAALFVFYHIPALDAYLEERYGDGFRAYAARTARFVPFLY